MSKTAILFFLIFLMGIFASLSVHTAYGIYLYELDYFINPLGKEKNKPTQIWTQGETEANSCWFPTIDSPNENMTQDIKITVDSRYVTLSNGLLVSSRPNGNGTRTDRAAIS